MIVAEHHQHQAGHLTLLLPLGQVVKEHPDTVDVGQGAVELAEVVARARLEHRVEDVLDLDAHVRRLRQIHGGKAVVVERNAGLQSLVPEVAAGSGTRALGTSLGSGGYGQVLRGSHRPRALGAVGTDGRRGPVEAVLGDIAVGVEVVQEDELTRDLVMVGRDFLAEQDSSGVAVAFLHISQELIESAHLLHHQDDVPQGSRSARAVRNRTAWRDARVVE